MSLKWDTTVEAGGNETITSGGEILWAKEIWLKALES